MRVLLISVNTEQINMPVLPLGLAEWDFYYSVDQVKPKKQSMKA
jgi:hypothetical protein